MLSLSLAGSSGEGEVRAMTRFVNAALLVLLAAPVTMILTACGADCGCGQ